MRAERTAPLGGIVAEIEIVVVLWILRHREVVLQWRGIKRRAAFPATDHAGAQQHGIKTQTCRLAIDECVELRNQLLEASEYHERAIIHPVRPSGGSLRGAEDEPPRGHDVLAGKRRAYVRVEGGLRHTVQPAEMLVPLLGARPHRTELTVHRRDARAERA